MYVARNYDCVVSKSQLVDLLMNVISRCVCAFDRIWFLQVNAMPKQGLLHKLRRRIPLQLYEWLLWCILRMWVLLLVCIYLNMISLIREFTCSRLNPSPPRCAIQRNIPVIPTSLMSCLISCFHIFLGHRRSLSHGSAKVIIMWATSSRLHNFIGHSTFQQDSWNISMDSWKISMEMVNID